MRMNTRSSANPVRDMLVFLYTFGFVFSAIAGYFVVDTRLFVNKASHADGTVVALKEGRYSQTWPIVAFETASTYPISGQQAQPVFAAVSARHPTRYPL